MMISITDDVVNKLNNAAKYWNDYFHNPDAEVITDRYFDAWCKEMYGVNVTVVENSTTLGHHWLTWDKAEVLDDEKYTWFLLSF